MPTARGEPDPPTSLETHDQSEHEAPAPGLAAPRSDADGRERAAVDFERRFGGIARLYGEAALERFCRSHVCVIGVGGVGSWAAEALARSAIGGITLIDLDHVAESNVNRQVHALGEEFGKAKVTAMAERIRAINPLCRVTEIEDFVTPANVEAILGPGHGHEFVIDACDGVKTKAAIAEHCKRHSIRLITVGAAGGQTDPMRIQIADLSGTTHDPLLARVRARLRRRYGFSRDAKRKFGIDAVFSTEALTYPPAGLASCDVASGREGLSGLNCAGFGSTVCVTAAFGLVAVSLVLKRLAAPVA